MISHLSVLVLAASLGQAPAESAWLDSVPSDADVVVRVRGVGAAKDDLVAMLKGMSPGLAARAEPALEQGVAALKAHVGEQAVAGPVLFLLRGVAPEAPGVPPFAMIGRSSDYAGVLKGVAGGHEPNVKRTDAGYDSFDGPDGQTWYAFKGDGCVAVGPDKALIGGFAKPGSKGLGKALAPKLREKLLAGDVGLYVNAKALATRHAAVIDQAEQGFLGAMDQAGAQMGAGMLDLVKSMYRGMFASIKQADALALGFDLGGEGLGLSGIVTVKADSKATAVVARVKASDAAQLAKLPADSGYCMYMNLDAQTFQKLQMMGLKMISPGGKPSPEIEALLAKEQGRIETISSVTIGGGARTIQVSNMSDPKSYAEAFMGMMTMMAKSDSPMAFVKGVKTVPNAENYRGFSFTRVEMTMDYDKLAKLQPNNPGAVASMKAMYGDEGKVTNWGAVGPSQLVQVTAPDWAGAKALVDAYLDGKGGIGATAGYRTTRAKLPQRANILVLMSAQGFVRQMTAQLSAMIPGGPKPAPELPAEPALIGFSLAPSAPDGFEFRMFVPQAAGPVFEKGLVPLFSGMVPPGNR